jgi:uncharacterized protein
MGKILFWLGIFAAIFIALKVIAVVQRKSALNKASNSPPPANPSEPPSTEKETPKSLPSLIACEKCGLHLPRLEAIEKQGHYFCSMEHAN